MNVLRIAKEMVRTNQAINGEQCTRNDNSVLVVSYKDRKIDWKSQQDFEHKFEWDKNRWCTLLDRYGH